MSNVDKYLPEIARAVYGILPVELAGKRGETYGRIAANAVAPIIERALTEQRDAIAHSIDVHMNKHKAGGCACPEKDQRSCGWRDGLGTAADLVRGFGGAS